MTWTAPSEGQRAVVGWPGSCKDVTAKHQSGIRQVK
jgi:hypothetical protein